MSDILNQQQQDLQLQLQELVKVGVGGKFKDNSDYTKRIQEELMAILRLWKMVAQVIE